jgi:hypothetical protein
MILLLLRSAASTPAQFGGATAGSSTLTGDLRVSVRLQSPAVAGRGTTVGSIAVVTFSNVVPRIELPTLTRGILRTTGIGGTVRTTKLAATVRYSLANGAARTTGARQSRTTEDVTVHTLLGNTFAAGTTTGQLRATFQVAGASAGDSFAFADLTAITANEDPGITDVAVGDRFALISYSGTGAYGYEIEAVRIVNPVITRVFGGDDGAAGITFTGAGGAGYEVEAILILPPAVTDVIAGDTFANVRFVGGPGGYDDGYEVEADPQP